MALSDSLVRTLHIGVPAAAAGADSSAVVCEVPFTGTITRCVYVPVATMTGAATNNRTHTLTERGTGGSTTVSATLAYGNGTNATAYTEKTIPLSGTAANLNVTAGDVLSFDSVHVGTGIAEPGGSCIVDITRGEVAT